LLRQASQIDWLKKNIKGSKRRNDEVPGAPLLSFSFLLKINLSNNFYSPENKMGLVGLPGFEPGSIEPKSTSLDQASRQPRACFAVSVLGGREDNFACTIKTLAKLVGVIVYIYRLFIVLVGELFWE
jgi:hypothetical protein